MFKIHMMTFCDHSTMNYTQYARLDVDCIANTLIGDYTPWNET